MKPDVGGPGLQQQAQRSVAPVSPSDPGLGSALATGACGLVVGQTWATEGLWRSPTVRRPESRVASDLRKHWSG